MSYVKLSSAVVAILVGGLKCRTQCWKGATQGSFQQSLVGIGSVVSEEKIFFKGLGAIRAKIGSTSDVDNIFSKMYSQYVLFRNKYS